MAAPAPAGAAGQQHKLTEAPRLVASIDGVRLSRATQADPLRIRPGQKVTVALELTNRGAGPIAVASITFEGRIAGLTFFSFATEVDFDVARNATKDLVYVLDTATLKGQVTGLVPSGLVLSGPGGNTVASEAFVTRMDGSLWSVYGLFGLGIVVLTALALVEVLLALARGRLPQNRWRRGTRFLAAGLGVGGVAVFSASALSKWLPSNGHWFSILGVGAVAGFVVGYLTPTPLPADEREGDEDDEEDGEVSDVAPADLDQLSGLPI
jgi:hypothetical protein